jgi:DNA-binding response OmpR family regulator
MSYKILYVEDEPFLSRIVSDGLSSSGYAIKTVADGADVIKAFKDFSPDICVLDIMLPTRDGYELTQEIRMLDETVPIIFVSAKSLTADVVKGFNKGGDDYLKKPFSMDELLVRIESLLKRSRRRSVLTDEARIYSFGSSQLDATLQVLKTPDGTHKLSYKESALLEMLIQHKNEVLGRQETLLKIWSDDTYYNTRSMDVFMAHLRKLLKCDDSVQIIGLRGVGYKLTC